jgi:hypothetical protein
MNGKDLLAVVLMIVPGLLLIALIALTLVPASVMQPFPSSKSAHAAAGKEADRQPAAEKTRTTSVVLARTAPGTATQKRMRDPWARDSYAKAR